MATRIQADGEVPLSQILMEGQELRRCELLAMIYLEQVETSLMEVGTMSDVFSKYKGMIIGTRRWPPAACRVDCSPIALHELSKPSFTRPGVGSCTPKKRTRQEEMSRDCLLNTRLRGI